MQQVVSLIDKCVVVPAGRVRVVGLLMETLTVDRQALDSNINRLPVDVFAKAGVLLYLWAQQDEQK